MPIRAKVDGTWREVSRTWIKVGGQWREAKAFAKIAGAWSQVSQINAPFVVERSPDGIVGTASVSGTDATSFQVVLTPVGGVGPFTFAWIKIDDGGASSTVENVDQGRTRFFGQATPFEPRFSVWRCDVVDQATGAEVQVTVTVEFSAGGEGPF